MSLIFEAKIKLQFFKIIFESKVKVGKIIFLNLFIFLSFFDARNLKKKLWLGLKPRTSDPQRERKRMHSNFCQDLNIGGKNLKFEF